MTGEPLFGSDAWWRKEAEEHNRELARKRAEQRKQIEKIEQTGNDRDKALLNELQGNVNNLRHVYEQVKGVDLPGEQRRQIARERKPGSDPANPGSDYIERVDYHVWRTNDHDTKELFGELQAEARELRAKINWKLKP